MGFVRYLIFLLINLFLAWVYHLIFFIDRYNTGYRLNTMSDSLFIIGAFTFLPSIMVYLGTYRFFYGFQYAMKSLFKSDFTKKYKQFSDYLLDKNEQAGSTVSLEFMLASITVVALAAIFALSWSRTL